MRAEHNRAAFNTTTLIRYLKTEHSTDYSEFTRVTRAKSAPKQHCRVTEAKTDGSADIYCVKSKTNYQNCASHQQKYEIQGETGRLLATLWRAHATTHTFDNDNNKNLTKKHTEARFK